MKFDLLSIFRKRPMSQKENKKKEVDVVTCPNKDQVIIHEPKTKVDLTKFLDNQHFRLEKSFFFTNTGYSQFHMLYTTYMTPKIVVRNMESGEFRGKMLSYFCPNLFSNTAGQRYPFLNLP